MYIHMYMVFNNIPTTQHIRIHRKTRKRIVTYYNITIILTHV